MTMLLRMVEEDFAAFLAESVVSYAAEKVASGQWAAVDSLRLSQQAFVELLPQGLATPDNHVWHIVTEPEVCVGALWMAVEERAGQRVGYVYELRIAAAHQRQGHARQAMLALEVETRALGLAGIALHVFGHNHAARALYAQLGYEPTNINLFKAV